MAVITARITRVVREEGDPWVRIHTDDDEVKRLDTKDEERARQAVQAKQSGEVVGIEYRRVPSKNTNPNTGRPYPDNFYFDGIVASSNGSPADDGIETVKRETTARGETNPKDAWRISLAAGAKLAVASLAYMPESQRSLDHQRQMALWWGHFLYTTPMASTVTELAAPAEPGFGSEPAGFGTGTSDDPYGYDQPPAHGDDDIPF